LTILKNEKIAVASHSDISEQKENLAAEVMIKTTAAAAVRGVFGRKKS